MPDKDKVYIFDTTMRDGEQSPGASMSVEEKIQISRVFDDMGIDIIDGIAFIATLLLQFWIFSSGIRLNKSLIQKVK